MPSERIAIVPLAIDPQLKGTARAQPQFYTHQRPLRLLFLGQVTLRKGIGVLFEAMRQLPDLPIALDVVGPPQTTIPEYIRRDGRVRLHGSVSRGATESFYREADVFVFPTLSDGFGLTQLEAASAALPIIASRCCGEVVQDGVNGLVLGEPSASALASAIACLVKDPRRVEALSAKSTLSREFTLDALRERLVRF